jgi:hypothetical protein
MTGLRGVLCGWILLSSGLTPGDLKVTGIRAVSHHGQTFVTWKDAAEGEDGAALRYVLYRSASPITEENVGAAEICVSGILNHSGRLFGTAFNPKDRLDPKRPMSVVEEGGAPLAPWSGLAVRTILKDGKSYYAVRVTDDKSAPMGRIVPGENATREPIEEKVAPIQPLKLADSNGRGTYWKQLVLTGEKGLPLHLRLHASEGQGGGASDHGDYYLYFGTPDMGYCDGLPGVFSVKEAREKTGNRLILETRDAIVHPSGKRAVETYWFGYVCVPQGSAQREPRAYPFTERRLEWVLGWTIAKYGADPERVTCSGGSMGAWGSTSFGFRHSDLFAAVYPDRPRTIQRGMPSLAEKNEAKVFMPDGVTGYLDRMDSVQFATDHLEDLPFYGWCCGRNDGFATWKEQVAMVRALTRSRHGFAFAWNNGDHSSGSKPMSLIQQDYPAHKFARNRSYPAFGNSSIDQDPGAGDPKEGDLEGGINLGFDWKDVVDEEGGWTATISNSRCSAEMTVDVTPRRCRKFRPKPGDRLNWTSSSGGSGSVSAGPAGLVTIEKLRLKPAEPTTLRITR